MLHLLDLFGTAVFAITGALAASRKNMDFFGVIIVAVVTALGGGTFRDILLGSYPIFWLHQPIYLLIACFVGAGALFLRKQLEKMVRPILFFDALGLAAFAIIGTAKGMQFHIPSYIAIFMGMLTGVGGGMLRDILCDKIPLILRRELYAVPALIGGTVYFLLVHFHFGLMFATILSLTSTISLRMAGIRWGIVNPVEQEKGG